MLVKHEENRRTLGNPPNQDRGDHYPDTCPDLDLNLDRRGQKPSRYALVICNNDQGEGQEQQGKRAGILPVGLPLQCQVNVVLYLCQNILELCLLSPQGGVL